MLISFWFGKLAFGRNRFYTLIGVWSFSVGEKPAAEKLRVNMNALTGGDGWIRWFNTTSRVYWAPDLFTHFQP